MTGMTAASPSKIHEAVDKHRSHKPQANALFTPVQKCIYPPKDASRGGLAHGTAFRSHLKQPFNDGFHRVSLGLGLVIADDAVPQDRRRHGLHILDVGTEFAVQRRIDFGAHD